MNKELLCMLILIGILCGCGESHKSPSSGFAIIVDKISYDKTKPEIEAYANAIIKEGLAVYIVVDKWQHPDSIKNELLKLYKKKEAPIEGAVFVGDIPVPMIRNAQHLSSAFKMDQERYPWVRSSIPSDRFYDDFDLRFNFLKQDSIHPLYFYYSLTPESPQHLDVDIYTGRIKPMEGKNKYNDLKAYLKKVVAWKENPSTVHQILFFTGHGYNSEGMSTWMDEKIALNQQFSYLAGQRNFLEYINFTFDDHVKFRLMAELQRKDLDIALLHHHGGPKAQYLDGMPAAGSVQEYLFNIKYYLRSKLRPYKESNPQKIQQIKRKYQEWLDVPDSWFDGTFSEAQTREDSVYNANLDIYTDDFNGNFIPNPRFIMLDACFTGSFHKDDYLAGYYIFNPGKTIVAQANSVNTLQDRWPDEMVGLLGLGLRIGSWHKFNCSLETHLIGDPTFSFKSIISQPDVNQYIIESRNDPEFWKDKLLTSSYADIKALSLRMIYELKGKESSDLLFKTFKSSEYFTVRAEAFKLLNFISDNNYIQAINLGINDSYELIQRLSAIQMANSGDSSHIPCLIDGLLKNNTSKRVEYNLEDALNVYGENQLVAELDKQLAEKSYMLDQKHVRKMFMKLIHSRSGNMKKYMKDILSDQVSEKDKYFNLRSFRNKTVHQYVPELIQYTDTVSSLKLKKAGIELLGWFSHSYRRSEIEAFCKTLVSDSLLDQSLRNEAERTMNRVK